MNRKIAMLLSGLLAFGFLFGGAAAGAEADVSFSAKAADNGIEPAAETPPAAEPAAASELVHTVRLGGTELDYCVFGRGEKVFVILPGLSIHSVMNSADAVAAAYESYTQEYTVYLFERPHTVPEGVTIRDLAEYTAEAMNTLGIKQADVFGASMGGMMAQWLAIDHPELVHKLILGSTLSKQNDNFHALAAEWAELASEKKETALLECFLDRVYSEATLAAFRDALLTANAGVTDEEFARFLPQAEACGNFDCYDKLSEIQCPVLVIGCEGDRVVTVEGSTEIADALGCEIYLYGPEYGHGVYDEAPDYRERCLEFLK